jgi:hypothetical protein
MALVLVGTTVGVALVVGGLYYSGALHELPEWMTNSQVLVALRQIDSGAWRVAWANYQVGAWQFPEHTLRHH